MRPTQNPPQPRSIQRPYTTIVPAMVLVLIISVVALLVVPTAFLKPAFAVTAKQHATGTLDDWTMYRHDVSGAGASLDTNLTTANVGQLHQAWSYKAGGGISTGVIVVNGIAYVGSWDGAEYAINVAKGTLTWKTSLGQSNVPACWPNPLGVMATASVVNGELYTAAGDGHFYALNALTGTIDWNIPIADTSATGGYGVYSSPVISNNFAYIGLSSDCDTPNVQGKVLRIDLTARTIANTYLTVPNGQAGGAVWGSPVLDTAAGIVYVATGNGTGGNTHIGNSEAILALHAADLSYVGMWQIPNTDFNAGDEDFGSTPVLFSTSTGTQMVAAPAKNGFFYGLNRANLATGLLWKDAIAIGGSSPEAGDGSISSASFANGVVYAGGGNTTINGTSFAGSIRAVDPTTGNYLWQHGAPGYVLGASDYVNGMVVDGAGYTLEVLNAGNGQVLFSFATATTNKIYAEPTVAEGMIFFSTSDGVIHALATPATTTTCPTGWSCADIGGPGMAGSEAVNTATNTWTINGGGADIWGTADQFHYDWQTFTGDGSASAQVTAQTNTSPFAKAGILFRQSTAANAPFYDVVISPGYGVMVQYRTAIGGGAQEALKVAGTIPRYLRVSRSGTAFSAFTSTDGVNWNLLTGSTVSISALAGTILGGLAVTAHNNAVVGSATFNSVTISGPVAPPPQPCQTGWTCADIGGPSIAGTAALNPGTNVWTIAGSGADIWGAADQFQFVDQPLAGDGTLSAHVTAQTNTSVFAKAGVMLRQSNAANAAYYYAAISPGYGILIQYRTAAGAQSQEVLKVPATVPVYLRLARSGTNYSVLTSPDGTNWTLVSGSTLALPGLAGSVLAGMAVTSHNNAQLSTATIDAVSLSTSGSGTPTPTPTPTGVPASCTTNWTCGDIGGPALAGNATFNSTSGVWTISGGGADIWGTSDQFQYAYAPVSVDSTLSARVITQTNTNPYAKAGVMLRQSNSATSAYYGAMISPGYGIMIQYRTATGVQAQEALKVVATVPSYLRIQRQGTTFTTFTSTDGTTWTLVAGSTESMTFTGGYLAGLAVTAHDNTQISTATLDSVTLTTP